MLSLYQRKFKRDVNRRTPVFQNKVRKTNGTTRIPTYRACDDEQVCSDPINGKEI